MSRFETWNAFKVERFKVRIRFKLTSKIEYLKS